MLLRTGTQDREVYDDVYAGNAYDLPPRFCLADTIIDVGAHIGCFALACLHRGAGKVVCFEPDPDNFAMLQKNLKEWGSQAELHMKAVWKSDDDEIVTLCHIGPEYTAMPFIGSGGSPVETIGLDAILEKAGKVRLLKLDCEGAEFPALLTCKRLGQVNAIVGEYHKGRVQLQKFSEYTPGALMNCLMKNGFDCGWEPEKNYPDLQGTFWGRRIA